MAPLSVAYISGTTLSQFVGAAFSCRGGRKYIFKVYGFIQNVSEITDDQLSRETRGVVILGAAPMGYSNTYAGMQSVGYLSICRSPSHKLSYGDTQRLQKESEAGCASHDILVHITSEIKSDGSTRVFYSVYEMGVQPVAPLQLKVDNLVGTLDGFTMLANAFARNVSLAPRSPTNGDAGYINEKVEVQDPGEDELIALAQEKADLTKRILELYRRLLSTGRSEISVLGRLPGDMETVLALHTKEEKGTPWELLLESNSTILSAAPRHVVENGGDLLCVHEGPCCSLYCLADRTLILLGTYVFRRSGSLLVFSVVTDEEVKDFPNGTDAEVPACAEKNVVQLSGDVDANFVGFIGDALLVGTSTGYLGMVFVSPDRRRVVGKSARVQDKHEVVWCIRYASRECVCVSIDTLTIIPIVKEAKDAITRTLDVVEGSVVSVAASETIPDCFFAAHRESRNLIVFHGGPDLSLKTETISLFSGELGEPPNVGRTSPTIYVHGCGGVCLLAVVYPDAVSFTAWEGHLLVSTAIVTNALTICFDFAFWKATVDGARLYVLQSDCRCLMYDVIMSKGFRGVEEIVVGEQVALPSRVACLMGGVESGVFLCWRSGTSRARRSALLQSRAGKYMFEPIEVHNTVSTSLPSACVLLLDLVPIRSSYGVVCLFSTGECYLSLYRKAGTVLLAVEEQPYDVTSCLALEDDAERYSCVLGFNDGDIRVFVGGQIRANVRIAHSGAVDRLLKLPKINEADDTLFVSMCTEMGTVCCHIGENAAVSRTMCSPSRPLTACLLNRKLEYMFLFSGNTGNLWHLPTCRLERVFRASPRLLDGQLDNLLEHHWASGLSIIRYRFVGREHYAIRINVDSLLSDVGVGEQDAHRSLLEHSSALRLMLGCLDESYPPSLLREDALCEALDELGLAVTRVQARECVWCAILLLCGLLGRTLDGASAAAIYSTIESLGEKLSSSFAPDACRQADAVQLFFSRFYSLQRATPAAFRHAFRLMAMKMSGDMLADVVNLLQARMLAAQSCETAGDEGPGAAPLIGSGNAFAVLLVLLSLASQRPDYSLQAETQLFGLLRQSTLEAQSLVMAALDDGHTLTYHSATLLGLVESHVTLCALSEEDRFQNLVKRLVMKAFGGGCEVTKQTSLEALERLVAQDPQGFLSTSIVTVFHLYEEYRPYIIVFLAHFVKNFPYEAYTVFSTIADIFVSGLSDLSSAKKGAASIYHTAVSQLLRVTTASLPSVSLQQSLRHLAVGRSDGKVVVYNLKAASTVTAFQAHSAPVLGVAYSGNTATLDIATIAETLDEIKVWRSPNQSSSLTSFFGGSVSASFKLVTVMPVPSMGLRGGSVSLLLKHFQLNWLSPQCVEFSSPWHDKVQVTLL